MGRREAVGLQLSDDLAGGPLVLDRLADGIGADLGQRGRPLDHAGFGEADVPVAAQVLEDESHGRPRPQR